MLSCEWIQNESSQLQLNWASLSLDELQSLGEYGLVKPVGAVGFQSLVFRPISNRIEFSERIGSAGDLVFVAASLTCFSIG